MRPTQQRVLLGILLVIAVGVYGRRLAPAASASAPAAAASTEPSAAVDVDVAALAARRAAQRRQAAELAWGRDPFSRATSSQPDGGLALSGILWDPRRPLAILNGQTVGPGDQVGGCKVLEIHHDYVVATDGTETFRLTIAP